VSETKQLNWRGGPLCGSRQKEEKLEKFSWDEKERLLLRCLGLERQEPENEEKSLTREKRQQDKHKRGPNVQIHIRKNWPWRGRKTQGSRKGQERGQTFWEGWGNDVPVISYR